MQADVGLRTATDGEFRRATWHMDFIYAIDGIRKAAGEERSRPVHERRRDDRVRAGRAARRRAAGDRRADLRRGLRLPAVGRWTRQTAKLTIPSPSMVHYRGGAAAIDPARLSRRGRILGRRSRAAYASQVRGVAALGCTYLQLDDTSLAYLNDPAQRAELARAGARRRAPARALHPADQRRAGRPAGRPDGHHAHVPGQLPLVLGGRGRVRLRRRGAVRRAGGRRVLPRVRRRPLRRVRAAALRAAGQAGRARPGDDQARASWRTRTSSSGASTRRRGSSRSSSWRCRRSAGSPRPSRATR